MIQDNNTLATLSQAFILQQLPEGDRQELLRSARTIDLEKNQFLFHEGDAPTSFFIMVSGWISLFKQDHMGKNAQIGVFGPRESFAEAARMMPGYPASAQAMTVARVAWFRWDRISGDVQHSSDLSRVLMESISRHLQRLVNKTADTSLMVAHERLARFLLQNCPHDENRAAFQLPFNMRVLARKLDLTPETLSRAFARLAKHSVSWENHQIRIDDIDALRQMLPPE